MLLAKLLNRALTDDAVALIDHLGTRHHCGPADKNPSLVVRLTTRSVARRLLMNSDVALGEGYMAGEILIERGNLRDLLKFIFSQQHVLNRLIWMNWLPFISTLRLSFARLYQMNFPQFARRNAEFHYNIGNSFYEKFLGPTMQYSCAYFPEKVIPLGKKEALHCYHLGAPQDLEEAQARKIELLIRKMYLQNGMTILDVGCGWGGLAIEIAKSADVEVLGISLSEEQITYAKRAAARAGVGNRVRFELCDYRRLTAKYDRIVSVGMFEHVGRSFYRSFFEHIDNALCSNGLFLLHTIGIVDRPGGTNPWLRKHVFPGGYIPALSEIVKSSERSSLFLTDIEILRLHYAFTLREWERRFSEAHKASKGDRSDQFIRMWRFYLIASEMAFVYGRFVNFQLQFTKDRFTLPITRDYLHRTINAALSPESGWKPASA